MIPVAPSALEASSNLFWRPLLILNPEFRCAHRTHCHLRLSAPILARTGDRWRVAEYAVRTSPLRTRDFILDMRGYRCGYSPPDLVDCRRIPLMSAQVVASNSLEYTAKRRQVPRLRASLVGVCCAARFRDCSRPRLAYSERTPSLPPCQYPCINSAGSAGRL
jgi:hypothetical protein